MDNSYESRKARIRAELEEINRVPPTLYFEDAFCILNRTYDNFLVTIPLECTHGESGTTRP